MNKFWIILSHTYITKLKTKSFISTTIITSLLIIGLTNISNIIDFFSSDEKKTIAVIDETEGLYEPFNMLFSNNNDDTQLEKFQGDVKSGEKAVEDGTYTGLLHLSLNKEGLPEGTYKAMSVSEMQLSSQLENTLQQLKVEIGASQLNLTQEQLGKLYEPVSFEIVALQENSKTEEELSQARGLVYVLLFLIYFAVIMYANMIAMEVATEKSSRVMEILISSVSPIKQMFAKIIAIGLLSLTQMLFFLMIGYIFVKRNLNSFEGDFFNFFGFESIPVSTIVYAVIFFILGYFLYATLAAFLGSLVSRLEDVNQMITPMTILVVIGFMIAIFGLGQPETPFITIASYIPFFTPMLMFMRVGMLTLPIWEPVLGIVILLVSIVIIAVFGARVYRGGVLMYGKSSSFKDIKKALQLTKKE